MPPSLTFDTSRRNDGTPALAAAGEIDLSNVDEFAQALTTAIGAAGGATVTVDLSAVEYLDSAAINCLFTHAEHIHIIAKPLMMRVFAVSGLDELTTVKPAPPTAGH